MHCDSQSAFCICCNGHIIQYFKCTLQFTLSMFFKRANFHPLHAAATMNIFLTISPLVLQYLFYLLTSHRFQIFNATTVHPRRFADGKIITLKCLDILNLSRCTYILWSMNVVHIYLLKEPCFDWFHLN